jgi:MEDS: MEthanogen/methylotroph, DcmR Sensory domain
MAHECVICGVAFEVAGEERCPQCGGQFAVEPGSDTVSERRPPEYGPGDHAALVYRSDERFLSVSIAFVREGIEAGHRVVAVLDSHSDALLRSDLTSAEGRRVETISPFAVYAGEFRADRTCEVLSRMIAETDGVLRVFGGLDEAAAGTVAPAEWARYERIVGDLYSDDALGLCLYDARYCPSDLLGAAAGHSLLSTPDRVHVCG